MTQCSTTKSGVSLKWKAPSVGGSPLTSYAVYRSTSAGTEQFYKYVSASSTSFVDTNIARKTHYFYRVAAVNSAGTGPLSNEVSVSTH
jgi:fibronectin type 3 domain-containing protein